MGIKAVKTYHHINEQDLNTHFSIARMEDFYLKRQGKAYPPHRHEFYTTLVIRKAQGLHKIDFNEYALGENQIFFVAPGQVHQLIETAEPLGFSMTFSSEFLLQSGIALSFIENLNLFQNYGQSPPLQPNPSQFNGVADFSQRIFDLYHGNEHMKLQSIGAYLQLLLINCNNICSMKPLDTESEGSSEALVRNFKIAVEAHYKKEHGTAFYASQLSISPDYLNRSIKSRMGKTAKEYIQTKIVTEAKRMLFFTDLTNKEIAYALGFKEPAHFSAFFKKCSSVSPSHFRKSQRKT